MADRLHFNNITLQRTLAEEAKRRKAQAQIAGVDPSLIAIIDTQGINNILASESAKIYSGIIKPVKNSKYIANPEIAKFYSELHTSAANLLTSSHSNKDLMWETKQLNQELTYTFNNKTNSFTHWGDIKSAVGKFNNFISGSGSMAVLDLETMGGKNIYGKQEITKITEFAFHIYDQYGANPRKISGFVGLSSLEETDLLQLVDRIDGGMRSEQDLVNFQRFAKLGHTETSIVEDVSMPGRFNVKSWVSDKAEDIYTKENFLKGIKRAREIGKIQEANIVDGLMTWERDLIGAMAEVSKNKDMLVSGYNVNMFDNPVLNRYVSQLSGPAKTYAEKMGLTNFTINNNRSFDLFALLQHAGVDPTFIGNIYEGEYGAALKQQGLTPFSQEAIAKRFFPDIYEKLGKSAHTADADVSAYYKLLTEASFNGDTLVNTAYNTASHNNINSIQGVLKGNEQQLFMATGAAKDGFTKQSIFGFTVDNFTGYLHTFDGYELSENQGSRATFNEYGTKKGVTYTINEIKSITANSEYVQKMSKVNPALAVEDLVMIELGVVSQGTGHPYADMVSKNSLKTVMIGTQEDIKSWMANNMLLYAEKDNNGEYQLTKNADQNLQKLYLNKKDNTVVPVKDVFIDNKALIEDTIRDGSEIHMNDSAARVFREDSYKRYKAFGSFSEELNKLAQQQPGTNLLMKKRQA